jgi:hypothetical protein
VKGRIPWWRKRWAVEGLGPGAEPTPTDYDLGVNGDITPDPRAVRHERVRRMQAPAFSERQRGSARGRADVQGRALRLSQLQAELERYPAWRVRSASWVAAHLQGRWEVSLDRLRQEIAHLRKI